jgi:hypothetical protein
VKGRSGRPHHGFPVKSRLRSLLGKAVRKPHRAVYALLLLPYLVYHSFRLNGDFDRRRWSLVLKRARRIRRLGLDSNSLRYSVAIANTALEQWQPALSEFESIGSPLEEEDEEALRYNCHAWALHNIGRTSEARMLLQHAVQTNWPDRHQRWAESFLQSDHPSKRQGRELLH